MTRREFIPIATSAAASLAAKPRFQSVIELQDWQLKVASSGWIQSFRSRQLELINPRFPAAFPRITYLGKSVNQCDNPTKSYQKGSAHVFEYEFSDPYRLSVRSEVELVDLGDTGVALKQRIGLRSSKAIHDRILVQIPLAIQLPEQTRKAFLPLKNGIGKTKTILGLDNEDDYVYQFSGACGSGRPQLLAIPMVQESSEASPWALTHCTDALFTSLFRLPFAEQIGQVQWIYPPSPGLPAGEEERTIFTVVQRGGPEGAMRAFYKTTLADVKPGPDWLHDVAMVDYDYLSKNGLGWFADIDKLTEVVAASDRSKVLLALHGWYDLIGSYTFEPNTQSFRKKWVAFPNARSPKVQSLGSGPNDGGVPTLLGTPGYVWPRKSVEALAPVPMSLDDVHHRIRYAKDRGFRVALYFADGLNACESLKDVYAPDKVLHWGGWEGPDTAGRVYAQNPIHPDVRAFYVGYIQALLNEYGSELDGFVWDETYTIPTNAIGPSAVPGYADRALMTLMRDVAGAIASHANLAFFSSDNIGYQEQVRNAPYCLMAHGTYQDSQCRPEAWPYGLFPNYRNAFWSCNWAPVSNYDFMKFGVDVFDTPVAISNGAFGDDIGVSEMKPTELMRVMDLFQNRKSKSMRVGWITESNSANTFEYAGRQFADRYNILS